MQAADTSGGRGWLAIRSIAFLLLILLSQASPVALAAPPLVGRLGDLQRLEFVGGDTFGADALREAVREDGPLQIAATPSAPLAEYLGLLVDRLTYAYRHHGFPNAKITAQPNPNSSAVVVRIEEGERFDAAEVRIEGDTKDVDLNPIMAALTKKRVQPKATAQRRAEDVIVIPTLAVEEQAEAREALWSPGEPARSGPTFDPQVIGEVRRELFEQGYFWTKFTLDRRHEGKRVDLIVRIDALGPKAMIHQWTIDGAARHKPAEVAAYLGLKQDQPVNLAGLRAIHRKLWDSGCFVKHDVQLSRWPDLPGMAALRIDLREPEKGRRLDDPLTPTEKVMLKFGEWVVNRAAVEEDLTAEFSALEGSLHIVANRRLGAVIRYHRHVADKPPQRDVFSVVATAGSIGLYSGLGQRRLVTDRNDACLTLTLDLLPNPAGGTLPDGTTSYNNIGFGGMIESVDESAGRQPGIRWRIKMAPFTLLSLVREKDVKTELRDGVLTMITPTATWRLNETTGALLEYRSTPADPTQGVTIIKVEKGAMDRHLKELAQVTTTNMYDKDRPIASFTSFMAHATATIWLAGAEDGQRLAAADAAAKVFSPKALEALDVALSRGKPVARKFVIPSEPRGLQDMAMGVAPMADRLFEHGSWPWTLTRQGAFVAGGDTRYLREEATRLYADESMGPIGCLAVAAAGRYVGADMSRLFARLGLSRLDAEGFNRDVRQLLGGDKPAAKMLAGILRNFQSLSEQEINALAAPFGKTGTGLIDLWKSLQPAPGQPPGDAMDLIQRVWWERAAKDALERSLKALAAPGNP